MTNTKKKAEMKKTKSKMKELKTPATKQDAKTMKMQPARKKTSKGAGKMKTKATKSQNTVKPEIFTAVFHHGGELVTENNKRLYRGGVQTIVSGEKLEDWSSKYHVYNLVRGWGYAENSFRIWTIFDNYYDGAMWKLREDDDYMEIMPKELSSMIVRMRGQWVWMMGLDDGFGVDADEKKKNEDNMRIVVSSIGCSETNTNFEDGDYESEELHSSDPDASDEERGLRYEKFRKEQMGKTYKPRFGMKFTCLADFRLAIRDWNVRNGYELRRYGDELRRVCKQNTVKIGVERPIGSLHPRFASFYLCFDGCKKGFNNGCRPFIGVDGCHLKTKYGGQLLIAVGRDPNDQYFPLAFGIVETETKESWRWFIQLLMEDIGQDKRIVFISDQQKGLVAVFDEIHYSKCDVLMNNLSESFNATILSARDKPILTLAEWIRNYLMNRIMQSSIKLEKWEHRIMPNPLKRLEKEIKMAGSWGPILTNTETWQVSHIYNQQQFIVDTQKQTCTCGFWELVGIPCRHAIAALGYRKQDPVEFVHNCYSKEKYAQCYGYGISAINGVDMWLKPAEGVDDTILPPSYKNGPGRPRKLRIRGTDEDGARKRRRVATYTCTRCSQPGHNSLSCKAKEQCPKGLKRKRKPAKGKGNADPKSQSQSQEATQTPAPAQEATQSQQPDQASQVQEPTQNSEDQNPTQASQIVNPTQKSSVSSPPIHNI
ncbi:hypothetical protein QL285_004634 [Trifolium repens]|nr:hypothetical protein QL285_004634 [Trifolium repens]